MQCNSFELNGLKLNILNEIEDKIMEKNLNIGVMRVIRETQVNTPESLLTITPGTKAEISCVDFSPYGTVKSAASRINARAGFIEFEVATPDNGATIVIKRNEK